MTDSDIIEQLFDAVQYNKAWDLKKILLENPEVDVNLPSTDETYIGTLLHMACSDTTDEMVCLLLAHPNINVNAKDKFGRTPFYDICSDFKPSREIFSHFLYDNRVNLYEPKTRDCTPFRAAAKSHLGLIKRWIVSGREIDPTDLELVITNPDMGIYDKRVIGLLEMFRKDPITTRHDVRRELEFSCKLKGRFITSLALSKDQYREFLLGRILADGNPAFVEHQLMHAIKLDRLRDVRELLDKHPVIDMNNWHWKDRSNTILFAAVTSKNTAITSMILAHPSVYVNKANLNDKTTLEEMSWPAVNDLSRMRLILDHPSCRSIEKFPQHVVRLGLQFLCAFIVSDKDFGLNPAELAATIKLVESSDVFSGMKSGVISRLKAFIDRPAETRRKVRREFRWYDRRAAEVFALIIFLCDGLLAICDDKSSSDTARFLRLASKLPLELQMILCNRVASCPDDLIRSKPKERAFKLLAHIVG